MNNLSSEDCQRLRTCLGKGMPLNEVLPRMLGETQVSSGIWRFFSERYPSGGVSHWNSAAEWKKEWGITRDQFFAFGEDIFGNQLVVRIGSENVFLWNHENGALVDLLLDPATLLEAVIQSGLEWIDFYGDGSLKVGEKRLIDLPLECHLHWTTPLILGGHVSVENTSVVERQMHLIGHAKLWKRLSGAPPGATIVATRKAKL